MQIHIIAVAGSGMGSLAGLLCELGHQVSGSDVRFDPPMGPALRQWGVRCFDGFSPSNLDSGPDLVVVGNVCRKDNPEVVAAIERGLTITHIAGALQQFVFEGTSPLVIAGTHGKTTTSALSAHLLDRAGLAPGFLIGGLPRDLPRSFRKAGGGVRKLPGLGMEAPHASPRRVPFVIEGDEYDTAYFEKTAKFLHYSAEVAVVTSIEYDHVDIYPNFASYVAAFEQFVAKVPEHGLIVANAADATVVQVVREHAKAGVAYYALGHEPCFAEAAHWQAHIAESGETGTSFDVFAGGMACGRFAVNMSGQHNVANALAAMAACSQGYGVRLETLMQPLAEFSGVKRRQELLGTPAGVLVYDDFAHHPTAVSKTLAGLARRHASGKLFVLFEPRSATACRNLHQQDYVQAFDAADTVLLAPLGRQGLSVQECLDVERLARELAARGKTARACPDVGSMVAWVREHAAAGDVVAVLSNGAFDGVHDKLLEALEQRG